MKYKAVIFDVGDTLLEHYPSQKQIYAERMKYLGFEIDDKCSDIILTAITNASNEQITKEQNGEPRMSDEDFNGMLDKAAIKSIAVEAEISNYLTKLRNYELPKQELRIIPGTVETLSKLKNFGFRLGIVSNHKKWLLNLLEEMELSTFFETIVISEIVGIEKPDVRIMEIALNNLSLDPSVCLYVGDHPFDVYCSKKAWMDCAWLTDEKSILPDNIPYKEDYRIQNLYDLLEII